MVKAKLRKKAPEGIAIHSEEQAIEVARKNAIWKKIPPAYQEPPEGEDPHERLNLLLEQEKRDCEDFRQGRMVVCEFTDRMQKEEKQARQQAGLEDYEEEDQQAQMYG